MFAVTAERIDSSDPLSGLGLGDRPEPKAPEGWTTVRVRAAALNHHDLWTLKGVGIHVLVTSRDPEKRRRVAELGADVVLEPGERLPARVDAVMETVGQATWDHSLKALRPGGRVVVCGATSGPNPPAQLNRVFFLQLSVVGSTMGTLDELAAVAQLLDERG